MTAKIQIELLKHVPNNQKVDMYLLREKKNPSLFKALLEKQKTSRNIPLIDDTIVETISLTFTFPFHPSSLKTKEKVNLETYCNLTQTKVKETFYHPSLCVYNVVSSLEGNFLKYNGDEYILNVNCFLRFCVDSFYTLGLGKTLYLGYIENCMLYLLNFDFILVKIFSLNKIKKISQRKKGDVIFHYEDRKMSKIFSLFNSNSRDLFVRKIISNVPHFKEDLNINFSSAPYEDLYKKRFLFEIFDAIIPCNANQSSDINYFFNEDGEFDSPKMSSDDYYDNIKYCNSLKHQIISKMCNKMKNDMGDAFYLLDYTFKGKKRLFSYMSCFENSKKIYLVPFMYNQGVINEIFNLLFFNFKELKLNLTGNKEYKKYVKIVTLIRKRSSKVDVEDERRKLENEAIKGMKNRPRREIEKKKKKLQSGKCIFKKLILKVGDKKIINYQLEGKDLEIQTGQIHYWKDKQGPPITYQMKEIFKMQIKNDCGRYLEIIFNKGDDKKESLELWFENNYEKYLCQSLIHNFIFYSLNREINQNQLTLNCNMMTWNVAEIDVPEDLFPIFNSKTLDKVDILAIGVQECGLFKIKDWMKHLKKLLNYYNFQDIESESMFQMFLLVFIKKDLYPLIDDISIESKAMGFAGIIGNKGGMVISFRLAGFRFSIVNCHLAPKPHKVLERNKHAKALIKNIKVGEKIAEFDTISDYTFWMGDLNYRVDYIFKEVIDEISNNNLALLLSKDQLIRQKQQNQIFTNFLESEINFWPTYRRLKGTDKYSNKKDQSPSWCDRILVKSDRFIDIIYYDSIQEVNLSDHLPVLSRMNIYLTVPTIEDVSKLLESKVSGKFCFSDIQVNYDFTEGLSELDIKLSLPAKVRLSIYYFVNENKIQSEWLTLKDYDAFELLEFEDLYVQCPPQFLFDLPHAKAASFYFVLTLMLDGISYEIGYSKFCLESIENMDLNLLSHSYEMQVSFRTRNLGSILLNSTYKM